MTLKTAALFALVGTVLLTIVAGVTFAIRLVAFLHGVVSAISFLASLIQFVGILSLMAFFWVFHRRQA